MLVVTAHTVTTELWLVNFAFLPSNAYRVFECSNSVNMGSYPTQGMHVEYVHVYLTRAGSFTAVGLVPTKYLKCELRQSKRQIRTG